MTHGEDAFKSKATRHRGLKDLELETLALPVHG